MNLIAVDVPPPGAGLKTVMSNDPAAASFAAGTVAVSCPAFTNCVGKSAPAHRTSDLSTKPSPVTVSVVSALPCAIVAGFTPDSVGNLFVDGGAEVRNKVEKTSSSLAVACLENIPTSPARAAIPKVLTSVVPPALKKPPRTAK